MSVITGRPQTDPRPPVAVTPATADESTLADTVFTSDARPAPSTGAPGATRPVAVPVAVPVGPLLPVVGGTVQAPLVTGRVVRHVNLDYAASAPALQAVADHVTEALPYYASVHRGAGYASQVSTNLYESARAEIARFVGARSDDVTVITRNTTDSLNLLASAVPADGPGGGEVLVLDVEHHANLLPWTAGPHRVLPTAATVAETVEVLRAALAERPATLVAVTGCSNVTGELLPIEPIVAVAHAHGARVVVDGAQLVPHRRVDLAGAGEFAPDYLAFSGHKIYAPFGAGVLIGRRDWLDAAQPHLAGGGAVRTVSPRGRADWAPAPQRHEAGTPNVLGAAALAAACRTLAALPAGALEAHEAALADRLVAGLETLPGVRVLRVWEDSTERVGVIGFTVAGHDPGRVAAYLSAEHGIGVRDGKFCAHPLLARLDVPQGALRASFGVGSRSEDADRLVAALRTLLTRGESAAYELDGGRWAPIDDPRPAPAWAPWSSTTTAGASPCIG
jgi:selenocysteine lyase/cysteine desulfurase